MCGLIYVKNLKGKANKAVIKRYHKQSLRGSDGFGFCSLSQGIMQKYKRYTDEAETLEQLKALQADEILFHHRFPTSTANLPEANHPILIKRAKFDYYVIHNGVISNAKRLKAEHNLAGLDYSTELEEVTKWMIGGKTYQSGKTTSFNDSEALAWDLVLLLEGTQDKLQSEGSIAFVCLVTDKQGKAIKLYFGRNTSNPLNYELNDNFFAIASESGNKEVIADRLYCYDYKEAKITYADCQIGKTAFGFASSSYANSLYSNDYASRWDDYRDEELELADEIWNLEDELEQARASGADDLVAYLVEELADLKKKQKRYA